MIAAVAGSVPVGASPKASTPTVTKHAVVKGNRIDLKKIGTVDMTKTAQSQHKASSVGKPSKGERAYQKFYARIHANHAGPKSQATPPQPSAFFKLSTSVGPHMIWNRRGLVTTDSANSNGFDVEPPDQAMCANSKWALEGVNLAFNLYPAAGGPPLYQQAIALNTFFGLDYTWFTSDPKCFHDPLAKRWYATALAFSSDTLTQLELITVSVTDDPTGQWNTYAIDVTNDGQPGTCPCLGDQPLLGTDANGVYITTNSYTYAAVFAGGADCSPDASGCFNGAQVYAISKAALFHGGVVSGTHFDTYNCCEFPGTGGNSQVFSLQPTLSQDGKSSTVNDGTEYVLGSTDWCAAPSACPGDQQDAIITGGITNTAQLNGSPPFAGPLVLTYQSGPMIYEYPQLAVEQKAGPTPLGDYAGMPEQGVLSNDDRMNQTWYDSAGNIWGGLNTEVTSTNGGDHVGVAYWDVHPTWTDPTTLNFSYVHSGYIAHKTQSVWFPGFAVPSNGHPTVSLDLSGPDNYPSAAYTQFTPGANATGTIYNYGPGNNPEDGFTCYPTLFGYGPPCRWGDYSTAQVMSDGTVWLGAEFIPPDSYRDFYTNWGTRIAHVNP